MTRVTGPDCAVMCNLMNTHTNTHVDKRVLVQVRTEAISRTVEAKEAEREGSTRTCPLLSRLIRGFRNKYN